MSLRTLRILRTLCYQQILQILNFLLTQMNLHFQPNLHYQTIQMNLLNLNYLQIQLTLHFLLIQKIRKTDHLHHRHHLNQRFQRNQTILLYQMILLNQRSLLNLHFQPNLLNQMSLHYLRTLLNQMFLHYQKILPSLHHLLLQMLENNLFDQQVFDCLQFQMFLVHLKDK